MAASLEIHDRPESGQIQVRLADSDTRVQEAPPSGFALDLSEEDRATLHRYHAAYRKPTIGAMAQVEAVEGAMRNLGRLLFELAFPGGSASRELLDEVMGRDDRAELAIVSANPDFHSLPWELMNDPNLGYFINGLAGIVRQAGPIPATEAEERTEDALHVLMLSPTPLVGPVPSEGRLLERATEAGGSLAEATVAALEGLNAEVSLDNPRPATLDALRRLLERNPDHYHIAHIDGATLDDQGRFLLERDDGGQDAVPAASLGEALAMAGGVPVALISAGAQSDDATARQWATAAMQMTEAGVAQVALLPATLHPDTTEGAARAFYSRLAQGSAVSGAVAAVRRGLMDNPERVSVYGKRVFWDWPAPAVYQSRRHLSPEIAQHQPDPLAPPVIHPEEAPTDDLQIPAAGQYGLIGRQGEIRQLERTLRAQSIVLLSGDTGVGKTELALGVCRWFLKPARAAYPGGVFYTAFEASHPAGIERVVHEIGTAVAGLDFAEHAG